MWIWKDILVKVAEHLYKIYRKDKEYKDLINTFRKGVERHYKHVEEAINKIVDATIKLNVLGLKISSPPQLMVNEEVPKHVSQIIKGDNGVLPLLIPHV